MNDKPVGTGPFIFVDYQKDANIRFKANPDYWGGKVKIDNLVFSINKDATARLQSLQGRRMRGHGLSEPGRRRCDQERSGPDRPSRRRASTSAALWYNTQQKPFDNADVRKALDMAIDKKALIKAVYQGQGQVATTRCRPPCGATTRHVKGDPYDPAKAKKMLDKAGVKDLTVKIWAMPVSAVPTCPTPRRAAEMIQADFAKVGVTADHLLGRLGRVPQGPASRVDRDGAVIIGWTGDNGDPDNFFTPNFGCARRRWRQPRASGATRTSTRC